jgi:pimeloyl-ACP methyl ester carboxylesterase
MKHSLLLLSGLLCDESFWTDIPQRLAGVARVSVVSFIGFSSIAAMARHVLDVAPDRFALAGHSMGGRVALEVVRSAPRRVTGLALLNTSVHGVRGGEPQSRARLMRLAQERGMAALALEWLPSMLGGDAARAAELLPKLSAMIGRCSARSYADQMNAMLHRPEVMSILPSIAVPTLLLSGSDDVSSPVSQQQGIRRRIAHASLFEIHGAGHMAPFERPDSVVLALREWLFRL